MLSLPILMSLRLFLVLQRVNPIAILMPRFHLPVVFHRLLMMLPTERMWTGPLPAPGPKKSNPIPGPTNLFETPSPGDYS